MTQIRPDDWKCLVRDALISGSVASVVSSLVLVLHGRHEINDGAAPLNGPSQWVWGRQAKYENGFTMRHTVLGYGIHHLASIFWAVFYELFRRTHQERSIVATATTAAATSALASVVDYGLTPPRLRPGFEKRLSRRALVAVYAAFAIGLAAASVACRRRGEGEQPREQR